VGNGGYDTIMAAYDDLPDEGGTVEVTKHYHEENGIVFDAGKLVKLVGLGSVFDDGDGDLGGTTIDISGGTGIDVKGKGHVIRDLDIVGEGADEYPGPYSTDRWGLRLGGGTGFVGRYHIDNVGVRFTTGPAVIYRGSHINSVFDITTYRCRIGHHVDTSVGVVNECTWRRLADNRSAEKGLLVDGPGKLDGNVIQMLWLGASGFDGGEAMDVRCDVYRGNELRGYGFEQGAGTGTVNLDPASGTGNRIVTSLGPNYNQGEIDSLDLSNWKEYQFGREFSHYVEGDGVRVSLGLDPQIGLDFANDFGSNRVTILDGDDRGDISPYPDMEIIGETREGTVLSTAGLTVDFAENGASGATLKNISVENTGNGDDALFISNSETDVTLEKVHILGAEGVGIKSYGQAQIQGCIVESCGGDEMLVGGQNQFYGGCVVDGTIDDGGTNNVDGGNVTL